MYSALLSTNIALLERFRYYLAPAVLNSSTEVDSLSAGARYVPVNAMLVDKSASYTSQIQNMYSI